MARQRLSGSDAIALHTETSTTPAHIVVLITLEASNQTSHAALHKLLGTSLPRLARFRSRLAGKPFAVGQPLWAEVPDFDPAHHLRRAALAPPGGPGEFADFVSKLTSRPLDRRRPLWQAWTIEGLTGGRWAVALKLSIAILDSPGGLETILARLLTGGPDDDPVAGLPEECGPGAPPSLVDLVSDAAVEFAENQLTGVRLAGEAAPAVLSAALHRLRGSDADGVPIPRTAFNEPLTPRREVAFGAVPMCQVKEVKDSFGVTTDDVVLAAATVSLRGWFIRRDALPAHPLLVHVPMTSAAGQVRLPVGLDDPIGILALLHNQTERLRTTRRARHSKVSGPASLPRVAQLFPPNVVNTGMRVYAGLEMSRRLPPGAQGVAATVAGPSMPVYCAGARVVGIHEVQSLLEGAGLGLTSVIHDEIMDVSVCVCPDRVSGVAEIADGIADAVPQLLGLGM